MASDRSGAPSIAASNAIEFHENHSANWSAGYRTSSHFRRRAADWSRIIDRLVRPGCRLLDVGCGSGDLSLLAAKRGAVLTCVDGSAGMLAAAKRTLDQAGATARFIEADVRHLPLEEGEFDVVLASSLLEYVSPLAEALDELRRVTRRGGALACSVPNPGSLYRHAEGLSLRLTGRPAYRRHVNPEIYRSAFAVQLDRAGFDVTQCEMSGTPPFAGSGRIARFAERNRHLATLLLFVATAR